VRNRRRSQPRGGAAPCTASPQWCAQPRGGDAFTDSGWPGAKREGDGRTPSGTFGFGFFFGVDPDPGVHFPYRRVHAYDVWDDDPSSPLYNEWVDDRHADPGADPEPMDVSAYDYGAVIGYNTARTPGLGSAIFLHIDTGTPTAGCVALPAGELLEILRWLNPAASPQMAIGVRTPGTATVAILRSPLRAESPAT
jgi:L,D-peptidoglycan transpeptidase YkuD (ErfK/YbiS/YcfS/YnhG family)